MARICLRAYDAVENWPVVMGDVVLRDLSGWRFGQSVLHLDVARYLEGCEIAAAMLEQRLDLTIGAFVPVAPDDDGFDLPAPHLVLHRDHGGFGNAVEGVQDALELARCDVLATAADHVFDAPDDVEITALVLTEQIPGAEPVAVERFPRRLRVVVIALQDAGTAHQQLPDRVRR